MARRAPSDPPVKHEKIALGVSTPLDLPPEPEPVSAAGGRKDSRFEDRINPRWLRIQTATQYSGINRNRLFQLIREGAIKTASLKAHRGAQRGLRLVDRFSLDLFLETLTKPVEEQLVQKANELRLAEEALAKEQAALAEKQRAIEQQLSKLRSRQLPPQ